MNVWWQASAAGEVVLKDEASGVVVCKTWNSKGGKGTGTSRHAPFASPPPAGDLDSTSGPDETPELGTSSVLGC